MDGRAGLRCLPPFASSSHDFLSFFLSYCFFNPTRCHGNTLYSNRGDANEDGSDEAVDCHGNVGWRVWGEKKRRDGESEESGSEWAGLLEVWTQEPTHSKCTFFIIWWKKNPVFASELASADVQLGSRQQTNQIQTVLWRMSILSFCIIFGYFWPFSANTQFKCQYERDNTVHNLQKRIKAIGKKKIQYICF